MENNYLEDENFISENDLQEMGIKIDDNLLEFNQNKSSYQKIDSSLALRLNHLIQAFPAIINLNNNRNVYRVVYQKGLGTLQRASKNGFFRGNIVTDSNNKIVGSALLKPLSSAPQIVGGIFSVMSIITGQYFMTQINKNLKNIDKGISDIQRFLENDKRSKLQSEEEFLKNTQKILDYILENETQKQSTVISIQKIRIDSLANMNFYKCQINGLKDIFKEKDKAEEIIKNVAKKCKLISEYWYSLYLYCFSIYLEPIISQNYNEDYITILKKDILEKINTYKNEHNEWSKKLEEYIYDSKALKNNIVFYMMKEIKEMKDPWWFGIGLIGFESKLFKHAIALFGEKAYKFDKNLKDNRKKEAQELLDSYLNTGNNIKEIELKYEELNLFNKLYNGKIELIKQDKEMFIKLLK